MLRSVSRPKSWPIQRWVVVKCEATVVLRHLKARHTEAKDLVLQFNRRCQRFEAAEDQGTGKTRKTPGKLQAALRSAWDRTPPADEDAEDFHGFEEFQDFA